MAIIIIIIIIITMPDPKTSDMHHICGKYNVSASSGISSS